MDDTTLAARIMDAWGAEHLVDGNVVFPYGDDPEWLKIKIAIRIVRQFDGSSPAVGGDAPERSRDG